MAPADHTTHGRVPVTIDSSRFDLLGIKLEAAAVTDVGAPIRAVATIAVDETRISHVHVRVSGIIEKLNVAATGQAVKKGQVLATIFSQDLLAAQNEYLALKTNAALAGGSRDKILAAARGRMSVLGMTESQIAELDETGTARRTIAIHAPRRGIVLRRGVSLGAMVDPGTELVTVADLSSVWALAEVPEAEIPGVRVGTVATLSFPASGMAPFEAEVAYLYPTLTERTRTLRVRFDLANSDGALRPGLYGTAEIPTETRRAITVPRDAVVDNGDAQYVFVHDASGALVPRHVTLGARLGDRIEVTSGLAEGEHVVASGVFLIDSESRLRATGGAAHGGH